MTVAQSDEGAGLRAAHQRQRRHWRTMGIALLGAIVVVAIMALGKSGPGHIRPAYAIATVIAMAVLLPLVVHVTGRTKDELDRLNALRANSFGLYVAMLGALVWMILFAGGVVPQPDVLGLYFATGVATLGRYAMLKRGW